MKMIHKAHRVAGAAIAISTSAACAPTVKVGVIETLSGLQAAWSLMRRAGSGHAGPAELRDVTHFLMD